MKKGQNPQKPQYRRPRRAKTPKGKVEEKEGTENAGGRRAENRTDVNLLRQETAGKQKVPSGCKRNREKHRQPSRNNQKEAKVN
ncbi:MAG: hypothetical protein ACLVG5_04720 [Clostridium sp.]